MPIRELGDAHRCTQRHHLHPSLRPGKLGPARVRSFPSVSGSKAGSVLQLTSLFAKVEELLRDYSTDVVPPGVILAAPAVAVSHEPGGMGSVPAGGKRLEGCV